MRRFRNKKEGIETVYLSGSVANPDVNSNFFDGRREVRPGEEDPPEVQTGKAPQKESEPEKTDNDE